MRFPRFIIGLTAGIALSAQAANIDEYINQLPAGANLAFMAQKVGARRRRSTITASKWRSRQYAKGDHRAGCAAAAGADFRFTTTLETKGSLTAAC
jgi:D-alanyl-D-alanine carboxypeptidase/D-alanyl-D-alanine-endopeptidase (penicillin-binding protein 4)